MLYITIEPPLGDTIHTVARDAVRVSNLLRPIKCEIVLQFNSVKIVVDSDTFPQDIVARYFSEVSKPRA